MTVTSASWTSSAADQAEPAHTRTHTQTSQSHPGSFSRMLSEGINRDKENVPHPAPQNKVRKTDDRSNDKQVAAQTVPVAKPISKPPMTGKLGRSNEQDNPDDAVKAEDNPQDASLATSLSSATAPTALSSGAAPSAKKYSPPSPQDIPNSGFGLTNDPGSLLMAMMMQSRSGSLNLPDNAKSDEKALTSMSPVDPGLASTIVAPVQNLTSAQISATALKQEGTPLEAARVAADSNPVESASAEAATAAMPGHLAFALRLNASLNSPTVEAMPAAAQSATQSALDISISAPSAMSGNAVELAGLSASDGGKKEHSGSNAKDGAGTLAFVDAGASSAPNHAADSSVAPADAPVAPTPPELDERFQNYSNDPVRNVQMQVIGEDNRRVDIRLIDRAGELRVSVKSGDSTLNQTLQERMPELTSRLESARYQTEVWMPTAAPQNQLPAERDNGNANGQQQGQQQDRPDWVDDLEGATPQKTERIN